MGYTGERLIIGNEKCGPQTDIYQEHIARYKFAQQFVENKTVMDIACGTGYGAKILADKAQEVWGGDISEEAIKIAKEKYSGENIHFRVLDASELPFDNNSFDLVVSFETIEHIKDYKSYLFEIKRVLKQGGRLILSTPDKRITRRLGIENKFHLKEFNKKELADILKNDFKLEFFGQRPVAKMSLKQKILQQMYFIYKRFGGLGRLASKERREKIGREIEGLEKDFEVREEKNEQGYLYMIILADRNN